MGILILATILTLSALYAPQPLLPAIVQEFQVSREAAAFLTTVSFFPLSIAPLFYGYLLESVPPRRMLKTAVLLLSISELAFFYGWSYPVLVGIRLFQGLLIPAILTALMTYIASNERESGIQRSMAIYVSATILGGFLGRACSGMIATWLGWRTSFLILAASLFGCFFLLNRLKDFNPAVSLTRPTPRVLLDVLKRPALLRIYLLVFCLFFSFAAMMNFLPFRLTEISSAANELRIGLMYTGYLMGMATSLNAVRIAGVLGGESRAILLGLIIFGACLLGLNANTIPLLFLTMFFFCGAMFLVHATASGMLNRTAETNRGIVNGLYVAFYYGGGTIGSYLPGFTYRAFGWGAFLLVLLAATGFALFVAASHGKRTSSNLHPPGKGDPSGAKKETRA